MASLPRVGWSYGCPRDLLVPQLEFLVFLKIQTNFRISGNYTHIPGFLVFLKTQGNFRISGSYLQIPV